MLLENAIAPSSRRNRSGHAQRYRAFVDALSSVDSTLALVDFPLSWNSLSLFACFQLHVGNTISYVDKQLRELNLFAVAAGYPNVLFDDGAHRLPTAVWTRLRHLLAGAKQFDGRPPSYMLSATLDLLARFILPSLDFLAPCHRQFHVLYVVAHGLLARAGEIVPLCWGDVTFDAAGSVAIALRRQKTGTALAFVAPVTKAFAARGGAFCVATLLAQWRVASEALGFPTSSAAPLFHRAASSSFHALSVADIRYPDLRSMVRFFFALAKVPHAACFGTHSWRAAGLQAMDLAGIPRHVSQQWGDWRAASSMDPYSRVPAEVQMHLFDGASAAADAVLLSLPQPFIDSMLPLPRAITASFAWMPESVAASSKAPDT